MDRAGVVILVAFALLLGAPLFLKGSGFVSSDEMYGFSQTSDGTVVPFVDDVGAAFVPMGSGASEGSIDGGVTPAFVDLVSVGARAPDARLGGHFVILASGLVVVGATFVLARTLLPRGGALAAMAAAAFAPPILFWSTPVMANMPTTAAFASGVAAFALYLRHNKWRWLILATASVLFAVALRRDSLMFLIPFLALLAAAFVAKRRWGLLLALPVAAYAGIALYRIALQIAPPTLASWDFGWHEAREAWLHFLGRNEGYHPEYSLDVFAQNVSTYAFGLYPLLAILGGLGFAVYARRELRANLLLATVAFAGLMVAFVSLTIDPARIFHDPPNYFSSLVRYALVLPVALALGVGLLVARVRERSRGVVAVALVLLVAAPGVVQATLTEPGLGWLAHERGWRSDWDEAAANLPEDSFVIGDEASKVITTRPVLAPVNTRHPLETFLPPVIDRLADRHSLRAFVPQTSFHGDWSGKLGEFVTDAHHTTVGAEDATFLEVVWTNATLRNVGILFDGEWRMDDAGRLESLDAASRFRATPLLAASLLQAPSPGVLVQARVLDVPGEHAMGVINAPWTPNDIRIHHTWTGGGTGLWRNETFFLPADTPVTGAFFVSGGLTLDALSLVRLDGVVEP